MIAEWYGIMVLLRRSVRREGAWGHKAGDNDSGTAEGFKDRAALKIRGTGSGHKDFQISSEKL